MPKAAPARIPEVPLPGIGKKGVTIMGHHVSNDALLMTAGGIVAAVVLYQLGKPSPTPSTDNGLLTGQPPASVEGTTTDSSGAVQGSGTPGPADPPFGGPALGHPASGPSQQSPYAGGIGYGGVILGGPMAGVVQQGPSPASHPKYIGAGPAASPGSVSSLWSGAAAYAAAVTAAQRQAQRQTIQHAQGPSPKHHPKRIVLGGPPPKSVPPSSLWHGAPPPKHS